MIHLSGGDVLTALQNGTLESIRDDGVIEILMGGTPVLTFSEAPAPEVSKRSGNSVLILSGDVIVAKIDAETADDADEIVLRMKELIQYDG